jgi:hypothetical protein
MQFTLMLGRMTTSFEFFCAPGALAMKTLLPPFTLRSRDARSVLQSVANDEGA